MIRDALTFPRTRALLLWGIAVIGFALCLSALVRHGIHGIDGGQGGGDVFAYWTAGRNLAAGRPVYGAPVGGYAAYLYPPPLAQLFSLVAPLPLPVVAWAWRTIEAWALVVAVGGVRRAGIACLLWPPVIAELDAGNVHLLIAAAAALAVRGDARAVLPAAFLKYASLAALPLALAVDRRGLARGGLVAVAVGGVSYLLGPELWSGWLAFSTSAPDASAGWYNLGTGIPYWVRLGCAAIVALLALRWSRCVVIAVTLALPVLWVHGLSVLVALAVPRRRPDPVLSSTP